MSFNKTIQMCIFGGNPNGRIMCELSNWNGRVYKIARSDIAEFALRPDAENTGVYFLLGKDDTNKDTLYIGEAEKLLTRLKQHIRDKEYWNDCIAVTSKDNHLNKAHVKYLENQFYTLAQLSQRASIMNTAIPTRSSVSEYDEAMLVEFIYNAKLLVNTLGFKVFDTFDETAIKDNNKKVEFFLTAPRGANARGVAVSDGFVVAKDSVIASETVPSMADSLRKLRESLFEKEVINSNFTFTRDYLFTSPSTAASIVLGRNANGRTEWRAHDKRTLKDIEELELNQNEASEL